MSGWIVAAAVGFASGVLSGMFGIGGGIITTPAIRLLMDVPALIAVGTPLPVIIPSAVTGARAYSRRGLADVRTGVVAGLAGVVTAVAGAWLTGLVGGEIVLIGTAALIAVAAVDMVLQALRPPGPREESEVGGAGPRPPLGRVVVIGSVTGLYSGFFGLGGGFVLVPMLARWLHLPIKRAVGTSLVAVAILAVPGTITHALLGHVDWMIAAGLAIGVVPGAIVGSRVTAGARDSSVRIGFALLLAAMAAWLAFNEIAALL